MRACRLVNDTVSNILTLIAKFLLHFFWQHNCKCTFSICPTSGGIGLNALSHYPGWDWSMPSDNAGSVRLFV